MADTNEGGPIESRATIKFAGGYDAPWLTVGGATPEELKERLLAAFGIDGESDAAKLPVSDLIINLSNSAHRAYSVANSLDGAVISQPPAKPAAKRKPAAKAAAKPSGNDTPAATSAPATASPEVASSGASSAFAAAAGESSAPAAEPEKHPAVAAFEAATNLDEFRAAVTSHQAAIKGNPAIQEAAKAAKARLA